MPCVLQEIRVALVALNACIWITNYGNHSSVSCLFCSCHGMLSSGHGRGFWDHQRWHFWDTTVPCIFATDICQFSCWSGVPSCYSQMVSNLGHIHVVMPVGSYAWALWHPALETCAQMVASTLWGRVFLCLSWLWGWLSWLFAAVSAFSYRGKQGAGGAGENRVAPVSFQEPTVHNICVNTANLRLTPIAPPSLTSTTNCPHIFLMASLK